MNEMKGKGEEHASFHSFIHTFIHSSIHSFIHINDEWWWSNWSEHEIYHEQKIESLIDSVDEQMLLFVAHRSTLIKDIEVMISFFLT